VLAEGRRRSVVAYLQRWGVYGGSQLLYLAEGALRLDYDFSVYYVGVGVGDGEGEAVSMDAAGG